MDIEQKGEDAEPRVKEPGAEAAAAKVWAIYIGEAEKYDKRLVESWRSDMEGMLIFAGLFSASLTAFLMESYKTLNPDSGDSTVRLLVQISQQLAASANGSTFVVPPSPKFTPPGPALICNALWFASLGLSLSCALIATLLEQWARDFIHRSEIHSAPLIRARIFSFLYYGLKRFNMHAVVEIIPLLLHTALLFFLAGLVAFLIPVNIAMAVVAGVVLAIFTAIYSSVTVLPLCYLDSPYRTPLSGVCWRAVQKLRLAWHRRHSVANGNPGVHTPKEDGTILDAVFHRATEDCEARVGRDRRALIWTVKSLSDDSELEPFVEAIPSILWGFGRKRPNLWVRNYRERHHAYADHFRQLVLHPDAELHARIKGLLDSCDTGLLSPEVKKHRQLICFQALWAITTLFDFPHIPPAIVPESLDFGRYDPYTRSSVRDQDAVCGCFSSASVLIQWAHFYALKPRVEKVLKDLIMCLGDNTMVVREDLDLTPVIRFLVVLYDRLGTVRDRRNISRALKSGVKPSLFIPKQVESLLRILNSALHDIRLKYLDRASMLYSLPYCFDDTLLIVQPPHDMQSHLPRQSYSLSLRTTVSRQLEKFNGPDIEWMDTVVETVLRDWSTQETTGSIAALSGFTNYLNGRQCDGAVKHVMSLVDRRGWLWESFAQAVQEGPDDWKKYDSPPTLPELLMALWRYTSLGYPRRYPSATSFEAVLAELTRFGTLSFTPSVLVLLKFRYFSTWPDRETDSIFPADSGVPPGVDADGHYRSGHTWQAAAGMIRLLAQFLESCAGPDPFPYKAVETLQHPSLVFLPIPGAVHKNHQIRLANAIRETFASQRCASLRTVLMNKDIFDVYALPGANPNNASVAWLDSNEARGTIKLAFTTYAEELSRGSSADLERVRTILREFERLHPAVGTLRHAGLPSP